MMVFNPEDWPEPKSPQPPPRSLRRLVADYALLAIAGVWMMATGGIVGIVVGIDKAGGKKK